MYCTKNCNIDLKNKTYIFFVKINQPSALFKAKRYKRGTGNSYWMTSQNRPTYRFYRGENNRFYLDVWKYLFSWLLHNLLVVEMLFHIQKLRLTLRLFYFKQHFSTSERIINRKTRALLNYTWSLHFILFKRLFGLLVGCLIVYILSYV